MQSLYFRCNGGHYFTGAHCPFDGWSEHWIHATVETFARLSREGTFVTIAMLRTTGTPPEAARRILLIEHGDPDAAFDALSPRHVLHRGQQFTDATLPPELS